MKNIIEHRRTESLNPNILKILDNPNCRTSEKMMNILVGKPEKSQLTLCDYKHIEKEINRVTKILSCAVEQKRKGVNILLHGEVGQGKSELSRLLSTLTQIPMYSVITQKGSFEEACREDRLVDLYSKQHILANSEKACINQDVHNIKEPNIYYYRDKDKREIDVIIERNGKLYPIEIKKSSNPDKSAIKNFSVISEDNLGNGAVVCLAKEDYPITKNINAIPISYI